MLLLHDLERFCRLRVVMFFLRPAGAVLLNTVQEPMSWMFRVDVDVNALPAAKDFVAELAEVVPAFAVHETFRRTAQAHAFVLLQPRVIELPRLLVAQLLVGMKARGRRAHHVRISMAMTIPCGSPHPHEAVLDEVLTRRRIHD